MKTSTKLIIALFASILLSMFAYGYLIKQQLTAGKFYQEIYSNKYNRTFKPLPSFKHLVINGNLYVSEESLLTRNKAVDKKVKTGIVSIAWNAPIEITFGKKTGYHILDGYEDIVKTKAKNDTLYVSFFKANKENTDSFDPRIDFLTIINPNLKSIEVQSGLFQLKKLSGMELFVSVKEAFVNIENIEFKDLKITTQNSKIITINVSKINLLQYSLLKSNLTLKNNKIQNFQKMQVDSLSTISLEGNAMFIEKLLSRSTQTSKID